MSDKDLPSFDDSDENDSSARMLLRSNVATETIDLNSLLTPDLTSSGSFDLQEVPKTAFGKLLKALPIPTLLVEKSGSIVFGNDACEKFSANVRALFGVRFSSLYSDPTERQNAQALIEKVFRERKPQVKTGLMQIEKYRIWARAYVRSVRLGSERFLLILIEDLTTEKKQIVLNEKYRKLVNIVPVGIAEFSISPWIPTDRLKNELIVRIGRSLLVDGNGEFARIHGYSSINELKGLVLENLFPCEQRNGNMFGVWIDNGCRIASEENKQETKASKTGYVENTIIGNFKKNNLTSFWILQRDITDRKKVQEALAESEARFRQIYENSPVMMHSIDTEGIVRNVNMKWLEETGYSREDIVGRKISFVMTRESAERAYATVLPRFWQEGRVRSVPYQYVTKNGTVMDVLLDANIVDDPSWGRLSLSAVRNITERKRAEEEARRMRSLLDSIIQNLPTAVFLKNAEDLRFVLWNKASEQLFGYSSREVVGKTAYDLFPRAQADCFTSQDVTTLRDGKLLDIPEEAIATKKAGSRLVHTKKLPILDDHDNPRHLLGISDDITDWKQAEKDLIEAREEAAAEANKLRVMIQGMDAGIVVADAHDRITETNNWFLEKVGRKRDELIGTNFFDCHRDVAASNKLKGVIDEYRTGRLKTGMAANRELAGMKAALRVQPIFNGSEYVGVILNVTDVSDLIEAKLAAESASKAKTDFLASMSHEIRTPMHGIVGMAELLEQTPLTEEQREYVDIIKASGDSLLALINDILDFSKIEAGKFELKKVPFSLREVLGGTMESLAVQAEKKGLELAFRVSPEIPDMLEGDPVRLAQVIINLAGNAIKFTDKGEVSLDVRIDSEAKEEVHLDFVVSDTGIGIPEHKQQAIFSSFTQVDTGMSRRYGGTGLGLAIAAKLAAMMDGTLWVRSEVGKGSNFHFGARLAVHTVVDSNRPAKPCADLADLPVLLVDDNATNSRILEEILLGFGMKPTCVNGAREALDAARSSQTLGHPFALAIIDAQMPEMDGFELAEELRNMETASETAIVMLTPLGRRGDAERYRRLGMSAQVNKPVKEAELFEAIQVAMGVSQQTGKSSRLMPTRAGSENQRRLKILLVEDNLVNQTLAIRLLERKGCEVSIAGNGKEALAALEQGTFDLILMDVEMPEMNGLDATRIIRDKEKASGSHIPIIAMTAHAMIGDLERCLDSGMDGYLSKPVNSEQLFSAIDKFVCDSCDDGPTHEEKGRIDPEKVIERMGGDTALLKELTGLFFDEFPKLLHQIKEAVRNKEAETLRTAAHTLKGMIGNFSAEHAVELAVRLENRAKADDTEGAREVIVLLERELMCVRDALGKLVEDAS
ncbi:MAG TPA: PAS domain S-box protein [Desulfomonilaceae bacterium]|nr:PAS domain S-box protein [Desulfomonilaceae bacterium]